MDENIVYVVNEKKNTVTAILYPDPDCLVKELLTIMEKSTNSQAEFVMVHNGEFSVKSKYVGTAYCHPEDTFDVEKGQRIARLKALKAYMNDRKRITEKFVNIFRDIACRCDPMHAHSCLAMTNIISALDKNK